MSIALDPPAATVTDRQALAAGYRLCALFGWENVIYNHLALRSSSDPRRFFLKPHRLMFSEVRASDLIELHMDGKAVNEKDGLNAAGWTIHSAVLGARPDVNCVVHVHPIAGLAMCGSSSELLPLNQGAMRYYNRVSYHAYEGISDDEAECARIVEHLGPTNKVMIMRNHGLLTCGATVAEALTHMRYLALSCEVQMRIEASGARMVIPPHELCEATAKQWEHYVSINDGPEWDAYLRMADRADPSFRD